MKNTYTTKKTKDLVVFHLNKYQDILETVKTKQIERNENLDDTRDNDDEIEFISNNEKDLLHNSLLNLIKDSI